jgi:serine/threonine protein kinase
VLIDKDGHVKLGDFGLAKDGVWSAVEGAKSICGTPEYMAPEVNPWLLCDGLAWEVSSRDPPTNAAQVLNKVGHGHAVDWWGLGMILYEMLTGLPPWYTKDRQKLFQRLRHAPLRVPPSMSIECASLVSALLCRDPRERLGADGAAAIQAHPFFTRLDWLALEKRQVSPPIDPMEGLEGAAEERDNTANFDPQFTRLDVETDNEGAEEGEHFEHFEGFSFMGSGSLEVGKPRGGLS